MTVPDPATISGEPIVAEPSTGGVPMSVRAACAALFAMAALLLGQLVVTVYELATLDSTLARVSQGTGATGAEIQDFKADESSASYLFAGLTVFFVGFLCLAAVNSQRGRRSGQVLACVYSAPLVMCSVLPFVPGSQTRLEAAYGAAEPAWAAAVDYATFAVSPLAILAVCLLLTRRARRHFSWLPPAPPGYMWVPAQIPWPYAHPTSQQKDSS